MEYGKIGLDIFVSNMTYLAILSYSLNYIKHILQGVFTHNGCVQNQSLMIFVKFYGNDLVGHLIVIMLLPLVLKERTLIKST